LDLVRCDRVGGGGHYADLRCHLGLSYHGVLPENLEGAIFGHSLKTYGWVYLVVGVVLILCAFALFGRSQIARWVGVAAGAIGAISAVWWMPYYPIWSLTYVALGTLVIYALAAHGERTVEV